MNRQPRTLLTPRDRVLMRLAVAQLRANGNSQPKIAAALKISQSLVWKLSHEASEAQILIDQPYLNLDAIKSDDMEEARVRYLGGNRTLTESLAATRKGKRLLRIAVLPDDVNVFAMSAARYIFRLLTRSTCAGIMYGRTLAKVVDFMYQSRTKDAPPMDRLSCIPLSGTPVHLINLREQIYTSSHLAGQLQSALNPRDSTQPPLPSLEAVPAYVARRYLRRREEPRDSATALGVSDFVASMPGYKKIFRRRKGSYIMKIDSLITGVGIIDANPQSKDRFVTGAFIRERIHAEGTHDATAESLSRICVGDIGGILVPRAGKRSDEAARNLVKNLNRGWTGIRQGDLTRISASAREEGPPGVILISLGDPASPATSAAKAEIIREVIRLGYVNHVVCSKAIASHLG